MKNTSQANLCDSASGYSPGLCDPLIRAMAGLKDRLQTRYERLFPGQTAMIRHVIEDAEAEAWSMSFPHLLLPDLVEARINGFQRRPAFAGRVFARAT